MQRQLLKLTIDLVPKTCWYSNLRKQMPRSQWNKLCREVYANAGHACEVCGAEGRLNCHEVWEYADDKFVQKLLGFVALCKLCHLVKHFGMAQILASQGHLDLDPVVKHFKTVNNVGQKEFDSHKTETFRIWRERSQHEWQTDLGDFGALMNPRTV